MLKRGFIKEKLKKSHAASFFIIFTVLFMVFNAVLLKDAWENEDSSKKFSTAPAPAGVHSKINIDGNIALDNFCAGNGTSGNYTHPHVIEDYEIDAGGFGSGIEIRNTDLYLIIQNITVTNSGAVGFDAGIYLNNCTNVKIMGVNSSFNKQGFYIADSYNSNVSGNNAWNNTDYGFYLDSSSNNTLSGNNATENNYGFCLYSSSNNTLSGNDAWNNTNYGFLLYSSSNNTLSGNNASNNEYGFYLYSSSNNTLSGNNATENDYGFYLDSSSNNTLSGNNATENNYGFLLYSSSNNTLSGNNASDNNRGFSLLDSSNNNTLSGNNATENNYGFHLSSSSNNTLSGNNASNNEYGFYLYFSSNNNTLSGNNVSYNSNDGIYLISSDNNTLSGNSIFLNVDNGVYLFSASDGNEVKFNIIVGNGGGDIEDLGSFNNIHDNTVTESDGPHSKIIIDGNTALEEFCNYNLTDGTPSNPHVIDNYIINAGDSGSGIEIRNTDLYLIIRNITAVNSGSSWGNSGIKLDNCKNVNITSSNLNNNFFGILLTWSNNNTVSGNNAWNNSEEGFDIDHSNNNTFSKNNVWNNYNSGFSLWDSHYNKFYLNNITGNMVNNADDYGTNNEWDNGYIGNYWGDYLVQNPGASDIGGIWDTPYVISGNAGSSDRYPLVIASVAGDIIPWAQFTANITEIGTEQLIQFTYSGTEGNGPAIFQWNFGDGSANSTNRNPIHYYDAPGIYTVTLTVMDLDGDSSVIIKEDFITVIDVQPTADFTANATLLDLTDNEVQFTFTGTDGDGATTFQWDFGDGSANSTERNPSHMYNLHGTFTVTLTVTDADGDTSIIIKEDYITVIDLLPEADFTANMTQIDLTDNVVQFTFTGTDGDGATTFQWNFGDGSANSTERDPVHQYNSAGNYSVTLTVTDADGDIDVIVKTDYIVVQAEEPPTTPAIPGFSFGWIFMFGLTGVVILLGKIQKKDRSKLNCS